jgi:hypothetical protein
VIIKYRRDGLEDRSKNSCLGSLYHYRTTWQSRAVGLVEVTFSRNYKTCKALTLNKIARSDAICFDLYVAIVQKRSALARAMVSSFRGLEMATEGEPWFRTHPLRKPPSPKLETSCTHRYGTWNWHENWRKIALVRLYTWTAMEPANLAAI